MHLRLAFWRVCLLAVLAVGLAPQRATAQDESSPHGKTMVRSYELPADLLDKYNEAVEGQKLGTPDVLARLQSWTGDEFAAGARGNPYTLVVKVLASAIEDDDIGVRWQALWSGAPVTMTGMGVPGARPGQLFQMVVASTPEEFRADRQVMPGLSLLAAKNIRMERVRVEVWSGTGETSWLDTLVEYWSLYLGAVVWTLVFGFLYVERKKNRQAAQVAVLAEPAEEGPGEN